MDTIGTKEAARRLHVSQQTVAKYCRLGYVADATQDKEGSPWHIPSETIDDLLNNAKNGKIIWKKVNKTED